MRVFVTGAQGQLARSLIERARARATIEIIALGRPHIDLERRGSAEQAIVAASPDVVINTAAFTAVDAAEEQRERAFTINAEGAAEVAAAAARVGATIIQISTDYVFDGKADHPYREDAEPDPLNVYGSSKLAGEERVRAINSRHVILRTSWVYSPFGQNFVRTMMELAETRDALTVVSDQFGSPSSAIELGEGILRMIESGGADAAGTWHLAGSGSASWFDLACQVMDERRRLGLRTPAIEPIDSGRWPARATRPTNSVLSCTKFENEFGFSMPHWHSALARVIDRLARQAS